MRKLRKLLKWTGIVLVSLLLLVVVSTYLLQNRTYDAPYPGIKASNDPAIISRGKYLVYGPAHCSHCHSPESYSEAWERGDEVPLCGGRAMRLPFGNIYSANLTSDKETGLGNIPDNAIARALRYGVGHDGRALPDFMPFHNASDEDLTAIISYLRTLKPVKNKVEPYELNFAGKFIKAFLISPVGPEGTPPAAVKPDTSAAYGKYLVNSVAGCRGCHTQRDKLGRFVGPEMAGGQHQASETDPEHFEVVSANLTPDEETGRLSGWNDTLFIQRFRQGKLIEHSHMPWASYRHMSDADLQAIFHYLQSLPPVKNEVITLVEKEK